MFSPATTRTPCSSIPSHGSTYHPIRFTSTRGSTSLIKTPPTLRRCAHYHNPRTSVCTHDGKRPRSPLVPPPSFFFLQPKGIWCSTPGEIVQWLASADDLCQTDCQTHQTDCQTPTLSSTCQGCDSRQSLFARLRRLPFLELPRGHWRSSIWRSPPSRFPSKI